MGVNYYLAITFFCITMLTIYLSIHTAASVITNWRDLHDNCPTCKIAIVKPIFTQSAYKKGAFYDFYKLHINGAVTKVDLYLLRTKVENGWDLSGGGLNYFKPLIENNKINVITDLDLHNNNIKQYHKLILLHSEYVTQQFYYNLRDFVKQGGTLILFDANSLYAQILYDANTNTITLKQGHGWTFNGTHAIPSVGERWYYKNSQFIGSNYAGVGKYNEENVLTNKNAVCLHEWDKIANGKVCTYRLNYDKGVVYHTGIYASKYIDKLPKLQELITQFEEDNRK